jgi:hypothetical protein
MVVLIIPGSTPCAHLVLAVIIGEENRHKLATEPNRSKKRNEENCGLQRTVVLWQIWASVAILFS